MITVQRFRIATLPAVTRRLRFDTDQCSSDQGFQSERVDTYAIAGDMSHTFCMGAVAMRIESYIQKIDGATVCGRSNKVSSYDRRSQSPTEDWFANLDSANYLRTEKVGGFLGGLIGAVVGATLLWCEAFSQ